MLLAEMRRAFDRHVTDDGLVRLFDLARREAEEPQQREAGARALRADAEAIVRLVAEDPRPERELEIEDAGDGASSPSSRSASLKPRTLSVARFTCGAASSVLVPDHVRDDVEDPGLRVAEPSLSAAGTDWLTILK